MWGYQQQQSRAEQKECGLWVNGNGERELDLECGKAVKDESSPKKKPKHRGGRGTKASKGSEVKQPIMIHHLFSIGVCLLAGGTASAFSLQALPRSHPSSTQLHASKNHPLQDRIGAAAAAIFSIGLLTTPLVVTPTSALAADSGASTAAGAKITTGGASTLQSGRVSGC